MGTSRVEVGTYETANNCWRMVGFKRGNMHGHDLNYDDGAKDADKGPKGWHQVAGIGGLGFAVAQKVGDWERDVFPWRRGDERIEEAINVKVPRVVKRGSSHGGGRVWLVMAPQAAMTMLLVGKSRVSVCGEGLRR